MSHTNSMAYITMADWTCKKNGCISPVDESMQAEKMSTITYMKSIPAEWVIAQAAMRSFNPPLLLRSMDQSFLTDSGIGQSGA